MDERQLNDLFAEAAEHAGHHAPPPEFDHAGVLARSRAAGERARRWQSGLTAAAVLVVAGAGLSSIQFLGSERRPPAALAEPAPLSATAAPRARIQELPALPGVPPAPGIAPAPEVPPGPGVPPGPVPPGPVPPGPALQPGPGIASAPGVPPSAEVGGPPSAGAFAPPAPSNQPFDAKRRADSSCARPDEALFAQLRAALPAVSGATPRPPADDAGCPAGARGVEVDVRDGSARGVLRVQLDPPGAAGGTGTGREGSGYTASARTRSGARLVVTVRAEGGGRIPYAARLAQLARTLARTN